MRKRVAAVVLWLAAANPAVALDIDVGSFTLANGMQVVVVPDHRAAVVTHMVWYRVGAADEPQGKSGIAHFLEHLMFKGTAKHPAGEFDRLIRVNGGDGNAFTTRDYTGYFQKIAKDRLGLAMELEADRMQNLVLSAKDVAVELEVVREERRERIENDPASLLGEQLEAALFTAHPYGRPVIGWMSEVAELTLDDALAFYRSHYTPANALLVVAGDVSAEEVKALAERHYGGLRNTFTPGPRKRTAEPAPIAARRVMMTDPRASIAMVQRNYLAPAEAKAPGREAEALDVLAEILGGGTQGRLYRELVVKQKLAAHAGAWYSGDALDYGSFGVYAAPNPGIDVAKVEAAMDAILDDLKKNGVSQEELDRHKRRLLAETVYLRDSQDALARLFGTALSCGQSIADILGWEAEVEKLTAGDIARAANAVLNIEASVTGVLLPEAK